MNNEKNEKNEKSEMNEMNETYVMKSSVRNVKYDLQVVQWLGQHLANSSIITP